MNDIDFLILSLHRERQRLNEAKAAKREMEEEFWSRADYILEADEIERTSKLITALENEIRTLALDGNQHPAVAIKHFMVLDYDKHAAIDWASKHLPEALALDTKFFEQHVKAVYKIGACPVVTIREEKRAQIATDLSKFLTVDDVDQGGNPTSEGEIPY
jgi:hypothetical protein